ncbi:zn-finger domain-containing protein [Gigaspora margarita]|uniref:Zn-finger domain-containing protein n=1 Tax=Gigaspora margarita TaxID=4874 RepID=A0A8H4AKM9_GIGMA|nr:zn-finger domain-containing protein [Gigaspora margarita]
MFDAQDIINKYSPEPNPTFDESNPTFDESNSTFNESSSTFDESSSTFNESSSISDEFNLLSDESGSIFKEFNPVFDEQDITDQKAVNEYLSDNSECSDIDKIDNAEFPSIAYRDFVKIWGRAQQCIPSKNKVLAIIIYSDATMLDRLGKILCHPDFISLGNIPTKLHNKPEAKALIGIIPTLQGTKEE